MNILKEFVSWVMETPVPRSCCWARLRVATKKGRDVSSQVEQGSYSIKHLPPPALREGEYTLATWLSADQMIMLRLSEYTGKPVVSTWSPNSKRWTRVTFFSWATLLSELYGAARESHETAEYDL